MANAFQPVSVFTIKEGSGITALSRVTDWQGTAILKAAVSTINYYVYDVTTSASQPTLAASGTCTVSSSWYDTYQTSGWDADRTGYNVACPIPASAFLGSASDVNGRKFRVEIIGTPTSGDNFWINDFVLNVVDGLSQHA